MDKIIKESILGIGKSKKKAIKEITGSVLSRIDQLRLLTEHKLWNINNSCVEPFGDWAKECVLKVKSVTPEGKYVSDITDDFTIFNDWWCDRHCTYYYIDMIENLQDVLESDGDIDMVVVRNRASSSSSSSSSEEKVSISKPVSEVIEKLLDYAFAHGECGFENDW